MIERQLGPEGMRQTEVFFRRAGLTIEPVTRETIGGRVTIETLSAPNVAQTGIPSCSNEAPQALSNPSASPIWLAAGAVRSNPSPRGPTARRGEGTSAFDRPEGSRNVSWTATRTRDGA